MKLFLTAYGFIGLRDKNGNKFAIKVNKENDFSHNLKALINKTDTLLCISNNPADFEFNNLESNMIYLCLKDIGLNFKKTIVLDDRNKKDANNLIAKADLIYFIGGLVPCQNKFLKSLNLKTAIESTPAVIVGQSAGTMNLSKHVYHFPERDEELNDDRWLEGLGLTNYTIIPHFNLTTGNEYSFGNINYLHDYYLPDSENHLLYGLPNGSYFMIEDNITTLFGEAYTISNGKITKICENGQRINL